MAIDPSAGLDDMVARIRTTVLAVVVVVVAGWSVPANASVCAAGVGLLSKGISAGATAAAGVPAFYSPVGSISYFGGVTIPGGTSGARADHPGFAVGGTIHGSWGKWGYRTDWYSHQQGVGCDPWWMAHLSAAATYRLMGWEESAMRISFGGGYGFLEGPGLDVGFALETIVLPGIGFEARVRYLPSFRGAYVSGPALAHLFRGRVRLEWRWDDSFQLYVGVAGGTNGDTRSYNYQGNDYRLFAGSYASALVGFEAAWER